MAKYVCTVCGYVYDEAAEMCIRDRSAPLHFPRRFGKNRYKFQFLTNKCFPL